MKVCHVTNCHKPKDIRIFHKECVTLVGAGHDVWLIEPGEDIEEAGVHVVGCGEMPASRLRRMTHFARKVYKKAASVNADVYHLHDPELLAYGVRLKRHGKVVIFDSHEDVPAQILDKGWIPGPLRLLISRAYKAYETRAVGQFDAVVTATSHIAEKFSGRAKRVVCVNNYPKLDDITFHDVDFETKDPIVCYAGGINALRGEDVMNAAMSDVDGELLIAGDHPVEERGNVKYVGRLDRAGINELYKRAVVGLCILKPIENYYYSQPIKMYEYMTAGIPFVCSDFPGWQRVVNESGAGICVNPNDSHKIAEAVNDLLLNRSRAQNMGRNGRRYVIENCTWENEGKKLRDLYSALCELRES